jgi:hypothetical protein
LRSDIAADYCDDWNAAGIKMTASDLGNPSLSDRHEIGPWAILAVGFALGGAAYASAQLLEKPIWPLAILATAAAGIAIALRPGSWVIWLGAAFAGTFAGMALPDELDSIRLMIRVLSMVAAVGAVVVFLPRAARRLAISLLVLFHFGGIFTAVNSVPPQPWWSTIAFAYVYRPYLEFLYMQNAYHFYAPEPGPPCMMWFYVKYEDGTHQWVKIPRREDFPLAVEYQRRLSMTESINQLLPVSQVTSAKREERLQAAQLEGIPVHPSLTAELQYRAPLPYTKLMLETYTRYIARHTPHPDDPKIKVTGIKVYRTLHWIVTPNDVRRELEPTDPTTYLPYYQGEYTADGQLKDPNDPLLYWLIPIIRTSPSLKEEPKDYCAIHAELDSGS